MTVVEPAVPQNHAAQNRKTQRDDGRDHRQQIGVKKGRR